MRVVICGLGLEAVVAAWGVSRRGRREALHINRAPVQHLGSKVIDCVPNRCGLEVSVAADLQQGEAVDRAATSRVVQAYLGVAACNMAPTRQATLRRPPCRALSALLRFLDGLTPGEHVLPRRRLCGERELHDLAAARGLKGSRRTPLLVGPAIVMTAPVSWTLVGPSLLSGQPPGGACVASALECDLVARASMRSGALMSVALRVANVSTSSTFTRMLASVACKPALNHSSRLKSTSGSGLGCEAAMKSLSKFVRHMCGSSLLQRSRVRQVEGWPEEVLRASLVVAPELCGAVVLWCMEQALACSCMRPGVAARSSPWSQSMGAGGAARM